MWTVIHLRKMTPSLDAMDPSWEIIMLHSTWTGRNQKESGSCYVFSRWWVILDWGLIFRISLHEDACSLVDISPWLRFSNKYHSQQAFRVPWVEVDGRIWKKIAFFHAMRVIFKLALIWVGVVELFLVFDGKDFKFFNLWVLSGCHWTDRRTNS